MKLPACTSIAASSRLFGIVVYGLIRSVRVSGRSTRLPGSLGAGDGRRKRKDLPEVIELAIGVRVMVTSNIATNLYITNELDVTTKLWWEMICRPTYARKQGFCRPQSALSLVITNSRNTRSKRSWTCSRMAEQESGVCRERQAAPGRRG